MLALVLGAGALTVLATQPSYESIAPGDPRLQQEYERNAQGGNPPVVRPGNERRLLRFAPGKTKIAFLYIHGFGASRAEGAFVVDKLARRYRANTLYIRLPGHGTNPRDQANTGYREYLAAAEHAFLRMDRLGERVIVIGTSMGGLLTTHLASRYPKRVAGIILASPFYDYASPTSFVLKTPGGLSLIKLVRGEKRNVQRKQGDASDPRVPGFEKFWYDAQYFQALRGLEDLRDFVARPSVYKHVRAPVLMFYYYADEQKQDPAASVPAMLDAFSRLGSSGGRHPLSRTVAVARGNHVLLSKWIRGVDHDFIEKESVLFLDQVIKKNQAR